MYDLNDYLHSNNFKKLCYALDISQEDIEHEIYNINDKTNIWDSIALIIYSHITKRDIALDKCPVDSSKLWNVLRDYEYYFQIFNPYYKETFYLTFRAKSSGKVNSFYLLDKYLKNLLVNFFPDKIELAKVTILILIVRFLINKKTLSDTSKKFLINELFVKFKDNPFCFDDISDYYEQTLEHMLSFPSVKVRDFDSRALLDVFLIIEDNFLANFIDDLIAKSCEKYNLSNCDYLLVDETFLGDDRVFQVFACGLKNDGEIVFKARFDDSKYLINDNLVWDLLAVEVDESSKYAYTLKMFDKYGMCYEFSEEKNH